MNTDDFFKYLKQNNLYDAYAYGKVITEDYSFANAVSFLGQNIPVKHPSEITTAYDLLVKRPDLIRINCSNNPTNGEINIPIGYNYKIDNGIFQHFSPAKNFLYTNEDYALTEFSLNEPLMPPLEICSCITLTNENPMVGFNFLTETYEVTFDDNTNKNQKYVSEVEDNPIRNLNTWNFIENYEFYNPNTGEDKQVFPNAGNPDNTIRASYRILMFYDFTKQMMYTARYNPTNKTFIKGTPQEINFENRHIRLFGNIGWITNTNITSEFDLSLQITFHNDFSRLEVQNWLKGIILSH